MKPYKLFLPLFISIMLFGCQTKSNVVIITGLIEGLEDSTEITLCETQDRMFVPLLTDTVFNEAFEFNLPDSILQSTKELAIMSRAPGFPPTWLSVWVSPGDKIKITGNDKLIRSWSVKSNNPLQKELNVFVNRKREYERLSQSTMTEAYAYFDSINAMPDRRQEFRSKIESLYAVNDSLNALLNSVEIGILAENKTYSEVWMSKLDSYAMSLRYSSLPQEEIDKMQALYDGMPDDLKKSKYGESIYLSLNKPKVVGIGDDMADADMWDLDGNLHRLEEYKGKYILLDFWSSGCGPCMMSMPEMKEVSEMYKDKLTIVSISSDTKEIWTKVSKEKNITWVNLNDFKGDNGIKLHYGVVGIPNYVVISPQGKIIGTWMGYGEGHLKNKVKEFVK